ncbi:MAG: hypothetical protein K0U37_05480 [Gammaproteobacteria bacterium]|nr:hypothetical protein [Gammaproteobacteria bacterium]
MLKKLGFILGLSLLAGQAMAFPCFITMVKGSCWKDYTVKVDVLDAEDDHVLMTITIPKGKAWIRQSFEAKTKQRFMLRASFTPAFWKAEEGRTYYAKRYWSLPEVIEGETVAWNVGACFPENFSGVPTPPDAGANCACDKREIPQVGQE